MSAPNIPSPLVSRQYVSWLSCVPALGSLPVVGVVFRLDGLVLDGLYIVSSRAVRCLSRVYVTGHPSVLAYEVVDLDTGELFYLDFVDCELFFGF